MRLFGLRPVLSRGSCLEGFVHCISKRSLNNFDACRFGHTSLGIVSEICAKPWTGGARHLDGRQHAIRWMREIAISASRNPRPPGLAAIVVGNRPDSLLYVRRKGEACKKTGIHFYLIHLPGDIRQGKVRQILRRLNSDKNIDGILVQLPMPPQITENKLLECISPEKDVDGLHPKNVGRLSARGTWRPVFMPCAPLGCMELLWREKINVKKKAVTVIGDSNIVGMPLSWLLRDAGASSVTILHSRAIWFLDKFSTAGSDDSQLCEDKPLQAQILHSLCEADVVIAAVGSVGLVKREWIKEGATVVDIGINAVPDCHESVIFTGISPQKDCVNVCSSVTAMQRDAQQSFRSVPQPLRNFKILGDVAAEEVSHVAGAMTSVPGGAGPMTIAALLSNTCLSASRKHRL
ncbi:5,10-methylene-tetrahydrofolate dehydrogenase/cyclohydrolase [Micromonas pusilla CCMP1545]|uniref:methenyltetrahydrofolate cyclohydrolase n=1 Tax=Micromonas pusilla (strain CCMP1545) TaxID=564608 RepID=C1MLD7_MICPC|nr:5,10-methylene-tetrahydrofolate dehydrogenase/cyclohydrolase [Micromonas pusilla CCMP1545]EEH59923.1 5,10-methylene-tetrahydrofolate dehydrogenase/cyclohydrolase [Micromonas pusilla CCMP1545]|eukprot:XP_003056547.1 5,10-methylene-tetrahydrofolate dehydrogenase/cyclohydrolase [Micromonas pusilla CCMP1545]